MTEPISPPTEFSPSLCILTASLWHMALADSCGLWFLTLASGDVIADAYVLQPAQ